MSTTASELPLTITDLRSGSDYLAQLSLANPLGKVCISDRYAA